MEAKRNYIEPRCKAIFVESEMIAQSDTQYRSARLRFDPNKVEEDEGYAD